MTHIANATELSFEQGYERLQAISARLNQDEVPVSEMCDLFAEGKGLEGDSQPFWTPIASGSRPSSEARGFERSESQRLLRAEHWLRNLRRRRSPPARRAINYPQPVLKPQLPHV